MNITILVPALVLSLPFAPAAPDEIADREAIEKAALDYVDGFYSGDAERVARGTHPSLQKVMVQRMPWGSEILDGMDQQTLVEYAGFGGERKPAAARKIEASTLAMRGNIATVRIDSAEFLDYAHVAKINDAWRIINVLWVPHGPQVPTDPSEEDLAAIEKAGLDYVDGFYAADPARIERALHPRLQKVMVTQLPGGREVFRYTTTDGLVDYTRTGRSAKPAAERKVVVTVHDVHANIATITIDSADFCDYAHVAKLDGTWKIVNVLWAPAESR